MLIGDAARISGLTIRALQHYDNIGLLPASGRQENGRRYYTENDMMKLEQIVFYRGLGFSLEEIKNQLIREHSREHITQLLSKQALLLYDKMKNIQTNIAVIEASQELAVLGKTPPWGLLSAFMQSLAASDLTIWSQYEFSKEQTIVFEELFPSTEAVLEFYQNWKKLSIKAAAYHAAGISPKDHLAQLLAADWVDMAQTVTGGKKEHLDAFLQVDENRSAWNEAERELIEEAEPFLDECIQIFLDNDVT